MEDVARRRSLRVCSLAFVAIVSVHPLLAQSRTFLHLAGSTGGGDSIDGDGTTPRFNGPNGIAIDAAGNLYVVEGRAKTIRRITPAGAVSTVAGKTGVWGSDDGNGGAARFSYPESAAVDSSGNVYVSDGNSDTIRKITPAGVVTTFAGSAGLSGSADGTGSAARFYGPVGIAADASGNLYVTDMLNHTVRKITPDGSVTTLAGAAGLTGSSDGTGSAARFKFPSGIAVDSAGNLFVCDLNNHTIRAVTPDGSVTTIAGSPGVIGSSDGTGASARFYRPYGIAIDGSGNLYVVEEYNSTIRRIDPSHNVTTIAGSPQAYGSADGTGNAARFRFPLGVAADSSGTLYVSDTQNNTIRRIGSGGVVTTIAGAAATAGSNDGTGSAARFNQPYAVAVDSSGNTLVADTLNHTIRKITSSGVVTTLAGSAGLSGYADGTGAAARFYNPPAIAVDGSGTAYVGSGCAIRKITSTGVVTTLAGSSVCGSSDGTGAAAQFDQVFGLTVDASGNVFVAEALNNTIRKVTSAGVVTTLAGQPGVAGNSDGTGSAAQFSGPWSVAVDGSGNVWVVDSNNLAIRKVTSGGEVTTFVSGLGGPTGVAVDAAGNLYVADVVSIRMITPLGEITNVGGGVYGGNVEGTDLDSQFFYPIGVAVDSSGNLFIADTRNHAIQKSVPAIADLATIDSATGRIAVTRTLGTSPNTATSWEWALVRRPPGSTATLSSTSTRTPTFTPDVADLYEFRLKATSASGARISRVSLMVTGAPPVITAAAPLSRTAGSAATVNVIAGVSDAEDAAGSLVVTATSVPAGIALTGLTNSGGTVSASIAASCSAAPGAQTITLRVQDSDGMTATANVTVTVAANTAPQLGTYVDATVTSGYEATITPGGAPSDNGSVTVTASASTGFTGYITADSSTGKLAISSPNAGTYTVTVAATDNCGTTTTKTFALTVNAAFGPPTSFAATATSTTQVSLSWDAVPYATEYTVSRSSGGSVLGVIGSATTNGYVDGGRSPSTTYVYQVCARYSSYTACSALDAATTVIFTDDPLAGGVFVKAAHLVQLRTAVNAMRAAGKLSPVTFTDEALAAGTTIKAIHLTELRAALDAARTAIGLVGLSYTDPVINAGSTTVKAAHVQELRNGVK